MSLRQIDLTSALRPSLLPNEVLLFVQDAVGLYQGKAKLAEYQDGQTYLTSHRACYVDNVAARERCVAVELKHIERLEIYAGFLKSSPKVVLVPKAPKLGLLHTTNSASPRSEPPSASRNDATWICTVCSFSNSVPAYFDPTTANENTTIQPCMTCGVKPSLAHLLKASIASISRKSNQPLEGHRSPDPRIANDLRGSRNDSTSLRCSRCTFQNHPSLTSCEICGASLTSRPSISDSSPDSRGQSPAPQSFNGPSINSIEAIKFSFRAGGEKIFAERLKAALQQRKWLSESAPPMPNTSSSPAPGISAEKTIGIAGLERRGQQLRQQNSVVIGNAFEDLEALMASAKEIIALAESLAPHTAPVSSSTQDQNQPPTSAEDPTALLAQLNLTTTRDMLSTSSSTNSLYLHELSRALAEFLTDDVKGILRFEGGIITLVDLWAIYNRARGGVELVSPTDFTAAVDLFEELDLPVRRRVFRSGLPAVQERSRTSEKTIRGILAWLEMFKEVPPEKEVEWDWRLWGQGVTVQDVASRFGWSVGVAEEEMGVAEESGAICREASLEGVRFWENPFHAMV